MVYRPATEKEPRMRAWPLASTVTRATTVLPTKNVTVPVGVPVPDGSRTVAVNVTACPTLTGLADASSDVVVAVPVGVPPPGATAATVAVNVTAWPVTAGLTDDRRATVVATGLTVTAVAAES